MFGEEEGRRGSNNVRTMQLFHELKQQFPTVPDQVVSACIAAGEARAGAERRRVLPEAKAALLQQSFTAGPSSPVSSPITATAPNNRPTAPDNNPDSDSPQPNINTHNTNNNNNNKCKRPQTLDIPKKQDGDFINNKPPVSPPNSSSTSSLSTPSPKRLISSGTKEEDDVRTSGPEGGDSGPDNSVVVKRHSASLHVEPSSGWFDHHHPDVVVSPGQRSYTSVNLTLRPPTSEPQPPIDITSKNASLTYSTSSFDSHKCLQSRLQITVSPTGGSVSSYRARPRSFHLEQQQHNEDDVDDGQDGRIRTAANQLHKGSSLQELSIAHILSKQRARIEKLRIEVTSEKRKLVAVQQEVLRLQREDAESVPTDDAVDLEIERQLIREIQHLRAQCESLSREVDRQSDNTVPLAREDFYENLYTGQRLPSDFGRLATEDGPWTCPKCTFQNHPLIKKCEQCDMAHIVHVSAAPGDNIHIHVTPRITRRIVHSWVI